MNRISEFLFTKNPDLRKKIGGGGGGGQGGGVDGLTDEQPKPILPLQLLRKWGHNNALMYKIMSPTSSIYDHYII